MAEIETSAWWLEELGKRLDNRRPALDLLHRYYAGDQPLAFASTDFRSAFAQRFRHFSANFCKLVVQAVEERLTVTGFRLGEAGQQADSDAWDIWQANQLDEQSQRAHREALISGEASVLVWPGDDTPLLRVQDPAKVIVAYGDDPLERVAALKKWEALNGTKLATLYFPDRLEKYQWTTNGRGSDGRFNSGGWEPRAVPGEAWPLPNPLGVVPIVPLANDPSLDGVGTSEIASVLPLQDALNKLYLDMLLASETGAFRQRWATGIEIPVDPESGRPLEPWKAAIDRWASTAAPDAKFGTFDATDLGPYVRSIEQTIQIIASTTRTPPHYLLGQAGSFPSGESLRAAETGLVAKALRRQRDFGEGWEEAMRLAFLTLGDTVRSSATDAETIWKDAETKTESEHVDALVKLQSLGVPKEQLWEDAGYSPQQIERFKDLATEEALAAAPAPPLPEPPTTMTISKDEMGVTRIARGPSR
jgi:hypothetical protein